MTGTLGHRGRMRRTALGVATAYRAGSLFDKSINTAAFGLLAIPNFVLALVLAYYVGTKAHLFDINPVGWIDFGQSPVDHFRQAALPTISLAAGQIAVYMRLLRSDMIATLQEDFVTMARAKGLSPARILWRHALRPSSLTLLTVAVLLTIPHVRRMRTGQVTETAPQASSAARA